MEFNLTGLAAALATFLGVWLGHVAVRRFEVRIADIRSAMAVCVTLGLGLWAGAFLWTLRPWQRRSVSWG